MNPLPRYIIIALAVLLVFSGLSNVLLAKKWMGARDARVVAEKERDDARGAATACSDATEALRELADKRHAEAQGDIQAAEAVAKDANARADWWRKQKPKYPADDCRSAADLTDEWIKTRRKAP